MTRHVICASQPQAVSRRGKAIMVAAESRRTMLLLAVVIAAVTFASASQVHAQPQRADPPVYLALGDSYPYGSSCLTSPCAPPEAGAMFAKDEHGRYVEKNDNFHVGYPEYLQQIIDLPLINAGCPGDVSTSFLLYPDTTTGPMCRRVKQERPDMLHVDYSLYSSTWAQMDYAENYLLAHSRVRLITLQVGGPEANATVFNRCAMQTDTQPDYEACVYARLPAFEQTLAMNLHSILSRIRATGYAGSLIVVEYPATDFDDFEAGIQTVIYDFVRPIVSMYQGEMAPVWERFRLETQSFGNNSCAAGLLIALADGTCNIHPTAAGHQLIARVIAEMPSVAALK